jgi:5-methylcytosine-specific restriction protein A
MPITNRQIEAAYDIASQVFEQRFTESDGANALYSDYGLNVNTARDFITQYSHMLQGKVFKRTLSLRAADYFLKRIASEHDLISLKKAIKAVHEHIIYYEGIQKVNCPGMRAVVSRHESNCSAPILLAEEEETFNASVQKSLADSPSDRQLRLLGAAKKPVKVWAITVIYQRNADVVAEVLHRASGVCERCRKLAPFKRKKDGTPYLEVHHKKQLASGGEDTVENAMALCANCHRELHFGAERANEQEGLRK